MMVSSRNLLFQGFIFRFHVKFQGCRSDSKKKTKSPSQDFLIGELRNQNAALQHEFGASAVWFIWVFPKIVGFPPKSSILIGFFPL